MFNRARNSRGHIKSSVGKASKSQALIGLSMINVGNSGMNFLFSVIHTTLNWGWGGIDAVVSIIFAPDCLFWKTLEHRWDINKALLMFKVVNNTSPVYFVSQFSKRDELHDHDGFYYIPGVLCQCPRSQLVLSAVYDDNIECFLKSWCMKENILIFCLF